ncbi:hypothetical protein E4T42_03923 [Aureobasidium subglaciale]|uniref:WD-like domain-containing protein n=1 Tax=Aureobasidium subglaciale (strain EXF-2481) TaxID=1043005 RepID=A0A074ZB54_AURSE|nr:uncharacterized protein AUEXF2481DRAFT_4237 [Aureobasidium subglaciale EXF-2481]KAI5210960.1 hypothetical protein E4T38_01594 [Aureobasidium subglaciale]KAI5219092.1 hypothetical protein E4T40_06555 [Aureobasidium subglaciale]KAI5233229.1 hypothetical protein E4T41_01592 [Aureobasidium subglaciale]KAI5251790.1 hypothetical protein E4T42_03923 [Aureobasidium subglaciale]KAI5260090.1 hypothetical protein E4T46_06355 [Aureobasidium subglaciale]
MSGKKVAQAAASVAGVAIGIALYNQIPVAAALPVEGASPSLYETSSDTPGAFIYLSNVSPTIFGAPATDFDYHVSPEPALAIEAIQGYASAVSSGVTDDVLTAFLNVTMAGTMTADQAADLNWKCNELSGDMAASVDACAQYSTVQERSVDIEKRSRWSWVRSAAHVANRGAVQILYGALGNAAYANFPSSPRSWCNNADGSNACISWSRVESWNHNYAQQMVSDALGAVDFDNWSAQANRILGSKKRAAADVCISNRADGCT